MYYYRLQINWVFLTRKKEEKEANSRPSCHDIPRFKVAL
jgi:hypothetical protein